VRFGDAQAAVSVGEGGADPPPESIEQGGGAGEDGGDREPVGGVLELDVVGLAQHLAVAVEQLAVQQVQRSVQPTVEAVRQLLADFFLPLAHWPILVQIISGIAATAAIAITIRYTVPSACANRPLTWSPM
jgi:hypothetical protein